VGVAVIVGAMVWMKPPPPAVSAASSATPVVASASTGAAAPVFREVQKVLEQRCYMCHGPALQMKGVRLDSPEGLKQHAQLVYQQAVVTRIMPMNNATGITDAERALIGQWFLSGAHVQ
jgi:uncharacterized membrane protein